MPVPDIAYKVEIAFTSTWRTPAASRTWTDVSAYVEFNNGMSVRYGRQDERGTADANELTLTLDNSDGRFTFGNPSSPYSPNIKIGRPIRLTATVAGVDYVRFVGFINEWPTAWPNGSPTYATATISASSRLSRLGTTAPIGVLVDQAVDTLGGAYYWPMTDATGAVSAKEQRGRAPDMGSFNTDSNGATITAYGVGGDLTGPDSLGLADGRPNVKLTGSSDTFGQYGVITAALAAPVPTTTLGSVSLSFYARVTNPSTADAAAILAASGNGGFAQIMCDGGILQSLNFGGAGLGPLAVSIHDDGAVHHYLLIWTSSGATGSVDLYVDGTSLGGVAGIPTAGKGNITGFRFAQPRIVGSNISRDLAVGRAAWFSSSVAATASRAILAGARNNYAGDSTDARLVRLAGLANIPAAELSTTSSAIMMGGIPDGSAVVDSMRRAETTEAGVLHDGRTGLLTLRTRSARYNASTALTIDATTQRIGSDYAPTVDRSALVNMATARNATGTTEVTYTDETSRTNYGDAGANIETDSLSLDEPYHLASWIVNASDEPAPRAPSITTDVAHWVGDANIAALLGLDVGSKVGISNLPTQAPSTSPTYFVEGYTEQMSPGSWVLALNVSPTAAHDLVLVLDSGTRGLLDTNTLAL